MLGKYFCIIDAGPNLLRFWKLQVGMGKHQRPNDRHHFVDINFGEVLHMTDTGQNQKISQVGVDVGNTP